MPSQPPGRRPARSATRPSALLLATTLAALVAACAEPGTTPDSSDLGAGDTAAPSDAPLFPDLPPPLTDAPDTAPSDTSPTDTNPADLTATDMTPPDAAQPDTTPSDTDATPDPCAAATCSAPNRGVCVPDPAAPAGYSCACDPGFAPDGELCVSTACPDERFRTWLTVIDQTPLPNTANPVRTGFDPLLGGDRIRVVVELRRDAGTRPLRVAVFTQRLEIDTASVRLDGAPTADAALTTNRQVSLTLPTTFTTGRLAFDATVTAAGVPFVALDARAFTDLNCPIAGSASGARLQLAGTPDPKLSGCNDLSDLRSLQLTDAILDKDTTVYEQRNGTFSALGSSYKILTQMTLCLTRREDLTVSLAGSADGTRPWTIDNFLLIESFASDPSDTSAGPVPRTHAWLTTSSSITAPGQFANGAPIRVIKHASLPGDYTGSRTPSAFTFPAGVVQLDELLPAATPVWLRFTGLDTGVAGHLSRLFVTSADPDHAPAECRSHLDCPQPTATNGNAIVLRSGCLSGQCTPVPCGAGCPAGQRCLQGFCTDGCDANAPCPSGQTCAATRCVAPAPNTPSGNECRTFEDCPRGEVCFLGRCEAGCFHPVHQNPTYADNNSQYSLCKTSPAACPRCPETTDRCWFNYCRQCELDAHCTGGQVCADYRCVVP